MQHTALPLLAVAHATPLGLNIYIAGDGFTLEQALATANRSPCARAI